MLVEFKDMDKPSYLAKDDGGVNCEHSVEFDKSLILGLVRVTIKEELLNSLDSELLMFKGDAVGIWRKELRKVQNIGRKSGRKEADLKLTR